ncbi:MAG: nicotinate phosphoribosyltransferase [Bacillota bacterium]|nr:nicotinate phosphoribosyltransferase [Bacillota bacterium]
MKNLTPASFLCDFYKTGHKAQYPKGTEKIYSTWTPRGSRKDGINKVVALGFQAFIKKYLIDYFNDNFFNKTKEEVINEYTRVMKYCLNISRPDFSHIIDLHDLGYLPIKIKAVKEGTLIPLRVPMLTIENTIPRFFWVTNFLETLMSSELWLPSTAATLALQYKKIVTKYAQETNGDLSGVPFQCHDFALRGMGGFECSKLSGIGHLSSFQGTDTIPAILYIEDYYNANIEEELIGTSINATEHSVQEAYGKENESETYRHLIEDVYPNGFVSIVSDTWNLWNVLENILPNLKESIMKRDGRLVIRPDSGDPIKIICGNPDGKTKLEKKGLIEILWDIFGGTITEKGYKQLDTHIGAIYGDAITPERCVAICESLKEKGFASTNIVFGVGSFTYQYNTRDTFCFALKATFAIIKGKEKQIFKDPITDSGVKKSLKGMAVVINKDNKIQCIDKLGVAERESYKDIDLLEDVFVDGKLLREQTWSDIRNIIKGSI